jgi:hypothetical protein
MGRRRICRGTLGHGPIPGSGAFRGGLLQLSFQYRVGPKSIGPLRTLMGEDPMTAFIQPIALTLLLALAPGCYRHGALLGAVVGTSIVTAAIVSSRPPPPPRVVYAPPPQPGHVWQPGYWTREHDEWIWIEGRWIARYPGYGWEPSHWVEDPDGHWRLIPGHWVAISRLYPRTPPHPPEFHSREMESSHA